VVHGSCWDVHATVTSAPGLTTAPAAGDVTVMLGPADPGQTEMGRE